MTKAERGNGGTIDVVVIGAGQAGLAMSRWLSEREVGHVVLEREQTAHSWKHERWDSLHLLTPNWMTRLPGLQEASDQPDEFDSAADVAATLERYAEAIGAPVRENTHVLSVRNEAGRGFAVTTDGGTWACRAVVVASGACVEPSTPSFADRVPGHIQQVSPLEYRRPAQLPDGKVIVVGASASGVQLADEIVRSGRDVVLCVGEHRRMLRRYRGMDIFWWMETTGMLDEGADVSERPPPSMQLVGTPEHRTLDLNALQDVGVQLVGRMVGINAGNALVDDTLAEHCAASDAAMLEVLARIDRYAADHGLDGEVDAAAPVEPTRVPEPVDSIGLDDVRSIVWATGFAPHFPFLDPAWLDQRGAIVHRDGIVEEPGLYVIGLPYTRRRTSNFINGVGDDARDLSAHLLAFLDDRAADLTRS
ncbi:MAG: FAD-dependent oxidoreductase [Ilumatobacter sp.]